MFTNVQLCIVLDDVVHHRLLTLRNSLTYLCRVRMTFFLYVIIFFEYGLYLTFLLYIFLVNKDNIVLLRKEDQNLGEGTCFWRVWVWACRMAGSILRLIER
jgi:hypothetical protein